MSVIPASRLAAALRRYGRAARLDRQGAAEIRILVSDLAPLKHSDLPADGISAEALALLPAGMDRLREGERIADGEMRWLVRSAVPFTPDSASDAGGGLPRLYQIHLADDGGGRP